MWTIGVARGSSSPEQLRHAGADAVVADLQGAAANGLSVAALMR
jgi:predicted Fe-Mo cluster-binding NifX family protein